MYVGVSRETRLVEESFTADITSKFFVLIRRVKELQVTNQMLFYAERASAMFAGVSQLLRGVAVNARHVTVQGKKLHRFPADITLELFATRAFVLF